MHRLYLIPLLLFCYGVSNAADCPPFYRFVDFGQTGKDGVVYRGGSFLRAEDFDGKTLLDRQRTVCAEVSDTNTDGHGYPIPVVSSIYYSPAKAGLEVTELQVHALADARAAADDNAGLHRRRVEKSDAEIVQGEHFLCAQTGLEAGLSCQLVSPYEGNTALVVYCDLLQCEMPVMAINDQLAVSSRWQREAIETQSVAAEVIGRVEQIYRFLAPITSLSPG